MLPAERHRMIMDIINRQGSVTVEYLVQATGVSRCTVRRDLDKLASEGVLSRTHGGAILPRRSTSFETQYEEKRTLNLQEKRRIGKAAANLVADGESLILDSGSTTLEIARCLGTRKNLTIVTNDLLIATEIHFDPSTTVMVTGGSVRQGFNVVQGSVAESFFQSVNVDKAFVSGDAVDLKAGLTNATFSEAALKKLIIGAGREVYLVVDHSKFGKSALAKVADLNVFNLIITDNGLSTDHRLALEKEGIRVQLA